MVNSTRFFVKFLTHPLQVGSVWPSGPELCCKMIEDIDFEHMACVVELGAGTGVITHCIAKAVPPQTDIISVELDPKMAEALRESCPRAFVANASAADLDKILASRGHDQASAIISGLPWTNFPKKLQMEILDAIESNLEPGGYFTTFAYMHGFYFPTAQRFRSDLRRRFATVEVLPLVWKNLPPAFVYRCRKAK